MFKNKEYVLAIYREGSFSKAAEKLYISQPSLSATIKRLEAKLAMPIFNRSTIPITLTDAGKEYVKYALEFEKSERDFEKYVLDTAGLATGTIRIGGSSLFSSFMLPKMISEFNQKFPKVKFEISEGNTKDLINKINNSELDIIIDNTVINEDDIHPTEYITECMILAVPEQLEINERLKDFRLSAKDIQNDKHLKKQLKVDIEQFKDETFILLNRENDTGKRALNIFKNHNISPDIAFFLDQQVTAFNVTLTGMGISFVSDTLIKNTNVKQPVYYYTPTDNDVYRKIYFYNKNDRYLSIACKKFIEFSIENNNQKIIDK